VDSTVAPDTNRRTTKQKFSFWTLLLISQLGYGVLVFVATTNHHLTKEVFLSLDAPHKPNTEGAKNTPKSAAKTAVKTSPDILGGSNPLLAQDGNGHEQSPVCTLDELLTVRSQLNPELCPTARRIPSAQHCSITQATKCVDSSNWLEEYYQEVYAIYQQNNNTQQQEQEQEQEQERDTSNDEFVAISVGCNKGFDALNTLRMGTYDSSLSKRRWKRAMEHDGQKLHNAVCQQDQTKQFEVPTTNRRDNKLVIRGEMHCFEAMPQTASRLAHTAEQLGYDKKGFRVIHAAVSKKIGTALFETYETKEKNNIGVENKGLGNCLRMNEKNQKKYCSEVRVLTLREYVNEHMDNSNNARMKQSTTGTTQQSTEQKRTIHHLSIDVEGYDADVLLGAGTDLLNRVEYLEFEYNWMGSWTHQHLYDVVSYLDGSGKIYEAANDGESETDSDSDARLSFTCYWAGQKRLWRITGCWMRYYDIHTWANVACVNRRLVPKLAANMEAVFRTTLSESYEGEGYRYRHRRWFRIVHNRNYKSTLANDPMLVTEPYEALVSTEYL